MEKGSKGSGELRGINIPLANIKHLLAKVRNAFRGPSALRIPETADILVLTAQPEKSRRSSPALLHPKFWTGASQSGIWGGEKGRHDGDYDH